MTTHVQSIDELRTLVGSPLGESPYHTVTQEEVNLFADATGDHQWIHVDPVKAKSGPFGQTIAHGYFTLSIIPILLRDVIQVDGVAMGLNYGVNKVRFTSPVPMGSEVRATATVAACEEIEGGAQVTLDVIVSIKDAPKPSCVAQVVYRYYR